MHWVIDKLWNGEPARPDEHTSVRASVTPDGANLLLMIDAPDFGDQDDPPPPESVSRAPGAAEGLWNHAVVEWFVVGANGHYLELEVGPHGHSLALAFSAPRVRAPAHPALVSVTVRRCPEGPEEAPSQPRWRATLALPVAALPPGPYRANACAIYGRGPTRRYLSTVALPGPHPDFHQPGCFVAADLVRGLDQLRLASRP